jgi:hypothetical protein
MDLTIGTVVAVVLVALALYAGLTPAASPSRSGRMIAILFGSGSSPSGSLR